MSTSRPLHDHRLSALVHVGMFRRQDQVAVLHPAALTAAEQVKLRASTLLTWLLISPLSAVIPGLILPDPGQILRGIIRTLERHPESALAGLLGLEASVWLHLILDGDPLPAEWSRRRRRQ